jgi:hypothetical protein
VVALVAPLTVAIGTLAVSGPIGRVQLNLPGWFAAALVVLVIGSGVWFLASLPKPASRLQQVAVGLVILGYASALVFAVLTANDQPRPRINASLSDDRSKITASITASSMSTDDRLAILMDALVRNEPGSEEEFRVEERIYRAFVGPDENGNVEQSITMPLPEGDVTDIGIKAFTGTESPACDDVAAQPDPTEPNEEEAEEEAVEKGNVGSGTGCVVISLLQRPKPDPVGLG